MLCFCSVHNTRLAHPWAFYPTVLAVRLMLRVVCVCVCVSSKYIMIIIIIIIIWHACHADVTYFLLSQDRYIYGWAWSIWPFSRSLKRRCYDNRFLKQMGENWHTHLHSVRWHVFHNGPRKFSALSTQYQQFLSTGWHLDLVSYCYVAARLSPPQGEAVGQGPTDAGSW